MRGSAEVAGEQTPEELQESDDVAEHVERGWQAQPVHEVHNQLVPLELPDVVGRRLDLLRRVAVHVA